MKANIIGFICTPVLVVVTGFRLEYEKSRLLLQFAELVMKTT